MASASDREQRLHAPPRMSRRDMFAPNPAEADHSDCIL
jgi:hypothetical protein